MNIFKDGYLKPEYINPNYRGLVGWPCEECSVGAENNRRYWNKVKLISASRGKKCDTYTRLDSKYGAVDLFLGEEFFRIPQFTPRDIPLGELCWVASKEGFDAASDFELLPSTRYAISNNNTYCVPYLIAATAEEAEERKDWDKQ